MIYPRYLLAAALLVGGCIENRSLSLPGDLPSRQTSDSSEPDLTDAATNPIPTDGLASVDSGPPDGAVLTDMADMAADHLVADEVSDVASDSAAWADCQGDVDCDAHGDLTVPTCGDGMCNGPETCLTCEMDCGCPEGKTCDGGTCAVNCPDGECDVTETECGCPEDCGVCAGCCSSGKCKVGTSDFDCGQNGADCADCTMALMSCVNKQCQCECFDGQCCSQEDQCDCPQDCGDPCAGKECGDDGCGGSCGECGAGLLCEESSGECILADSDGDGVLDADDNCPEVANPDQEDFDVDGEGDVCDADADGDTIADSGEPPVCLWTPVGFVVTDDGCIAGDVYNDACLDNQDIVTYISKHAVYDTCELLSPKCQGDFNGDGCSTEADGDVLIANFDLRDLLSPEYPCPHSPCNSECGAFYECLDKECGDDGCGGSCGECGDGNVCFEGKCNNETDLDGDGFLNNDDNCPEAVNQEQEDFDGDGLGDVCDEDEDGDGVLDVEEPEACAHTTATAYVKSNGCPAGDMNDDAAVDGDDYTDFLILSNKYNPSCGLVNPDCEGDIDGDGCFSDADWDAWSHNFSLSWSKSKIPCEDTCTPWKICVGKTCGKDGCGASCGECELGEVCFEGQCNSESDADGDEILNEDDNCPEATNPEQEDFDGDGEGDVCDDDQDADGVLDEDEPQGCRFTLLGVLVNDLGCPLGDLNGDGCVTLPDWGQFLNSVIDHYGDCGLDGGRCQGDINNDGCNDDTDYALFEDNQFVNVDGWIGCQPLPCELTCAPFAACKGKQCGSDGCDGSCGSCVKGDWCVDGLCAGNEDLDGDDVQNEDDNCQEVANPEQEDFDDNGVGDACDSDDDGDGDPDLSDCEPLDPAISSLATEKCNGWDDDCDGEIDEGTTSPCGGECVPGCSQSTAGANGKEPFAPLPSTSDNVAQDADGCLSLASVEVELAFIWIANSGENTVSKLDTATGEELARYKVCSNPSRTAVDLNGDVWVGCRSDGGVAKIGVYDKLCDDKNGNGVVDTSSDDDGDGVISGGEIYPKGQDECVRFITYPGGSCQRAVGVDKDNHAWVGEWHGSVLRRLHPDDGHVVQNVSIACNPYGLVIDNDGIIWVSGRGCSMLVRVDPSTNQIDHYASDIGCFQPYGITLDYKGRVWTGNCCCWHVAYRYDPADGSWAAAGVQSRPRGVVGAANGRVYVANDQSNSVAVVDSDSMQTLAYIDLGMNRFPIGMGVDFDGYVWAVNQSSSSASKIDPVTNAVMLEHAVGPSPYSYSDMTGYLLQKYTSPEGYYVHTFYGSKQQAFEWISLDADVTSEGQSYVNIEVRSADSVVEVEQADWQGPFGPFPPNFLPLSLKSLGEMDGEYLQAKVTMVADEEGNSPLLKSVTVLFQE